MRKVLHSVFKAYMHDTMLKTRDRIDLNQDEMAYSLSMSTRAYAALESGSSCCGLFTLIIFVLIYCPDRADFFTGLFDAFDEALKTTSTVA